MDGYRFLLAAVLAAATLTASAAPRDLTAAQLHAALVTPTLRSKPTAAMFAQYFEAECMPPDDLPFDRTCGHTPVAHQDDPSPWPDVFLALQGERIVAVLVDDMRWAPRNWRCVTLPDFDVARLCTPPDVSTRTSRQWARRWSTVLRSAG